MTSESHSHKTWVILAHLAITFFVVYGLWVATAYLFDGSAVVGSILFAVVLFVGIGHMRAWRFARQLAASVYFLTVILAPFSVFSPFRESEPRFAMWQLIALLIVLIALCLSFIWALTRPWINPVSPEIRSRKPGPDSEL